MELVLEYRVSQRRNGKYYAFASCPHPYVTFRKFEDARLHAAMCERFAQLKGWKDYSLSIESRYVSRWE